MAVERASLETVEEFLAQKRIAMVGISREPKNFSVMLFEELCRRGYDVVPVNPNTSEVLGRRGFARVQDIQPPVDAALLMTSSGVTDTVVRDCAEAGIHRVWIYGTGGQGAVSPAAVEFCRVHGIQVVPGECPYMFLPNAGFHRIHGFIQKIVGRYPSRAHAVGK
jgi:predicted CoA-binding protein